MPGEGDRQAALPPHQPGGQQAGLQAQEAGGRLRHGRLPLRAHLRQQGIQGGRAGHFRCFLIFSIIKMILLHFLSN